MYCRVAAKELSRLLPQLQEHNVRLIGVGFDENGLNDFKNGNFFDGELYLDIGQNIYKKMGYRRFNIMSIWKYVFNKVGRQAISQARAAKVGGDMKGDGYQNGGTLVVSAGGQECLLTYKQEHPAEHVELQAVLTALGISTPLKVDSENLPEVPSVQCNDEVCYKT